MGGSDRSVLMGSNRRLSADVIREIKTLTPKPFAMNLWVSMEDEGAFTSTEEAFHRSLAPLAKHIESVEGAKPTYLPYEPIRFEDQVHPLLQSAYSPANTVDHPAPSNSSNLMDLAIDGNGIAETGAGGSGYAANVEGSNWVLDSDWIQHEGPAVWANGTGGLVENMRIDTTWADGVNLKQHAYAPWQPPDGYQ